MSFAAEFTTDVVNVKCDRCQITVNTKESLHYMQDAHGRGPGRNLCNACYNHYRQKPTTRRLEARGTSEFLFYSFSIFLFAILPESTSHVNRTDIHRGNAAAQRGGSYSIM